MIGHAEIAASLLAEVRIARQRRPPFPTIDDLPLGDVVATLRDAVAEAATDPENITVDQLANISAWALIALAKRREMPGGKCCCDDCEE